MLELDPRWLSIELEAIQRDERGWDKVLKYSYDISVQRVFDYQAKLDARKDRKQVA
jgi:hypothetical protein